MLILTRRVGESLMIGDDVNVTVLGIKGNQVRIGVNAPKDVAVHRGQKRLPRVEGVLRRCHIELRVDRVERERVVVVRTLRTCPRAHEAHRAAQILRLNRAVRHRRRRRHILRQTFRRARDVEDHPVQHVVVLGNSYVQIQCLYDWKLLK